MITGLKKSTRKGKRYQVEWDGKVIHFGSPAGTPYTDGATEKTRENYWKRHRGDPTEKARLTNLTPSAAVLSAYLLWGESRDLETNLKTLNQLVK